MGHFSINHRRSHMHNDHNIFIESLLPQHFFIDIVSAHNFD